MLGRYNTYIGALTSVEVEVVGAVALFAGRQ